jgi:TPR repeat protein
MTDRGGTGTAGEHRAQPGLIERLRFAADDGHAESMFLLGLAAVQGRGVIQDDVEAARWFHLAAKKGCAKARCALGFLYAKGRGVRYDPVQAYVEFKLAAAAGDPQAVDCMRRLRLRLDQRQIHRAEERLSKLGV